jgi:hypothetical protein
VKFGRLAADSGEGPSRAGDRGPDQQEDVVGLHPLAVRFHSSAVAVALAIAAVVAASIGVSAADAKQDEVAEVEPTEPTGPTEGTEGGEPVSLFDRLDELESLLPEAPPPTGIELSDDGTWGALAGDAGSAHATLGTLEGDLRRLYVEADDADGPAADAIALVARGWLDLWQGTGALAAWEANDLAFPLETADDDEVATGADELRGQAEKGLELVLQGRARHLEGYRLLREVGEAEPPLQARFDSRAAEAEAFDADVRPVVLRLLSQRTTGLYVQTERFDSNAPGVRARARSLQLVCVDRDAIAEHDVVDEELLAELERATPSRADCPGELDPDTEAP